MVQWTPVESISRSRCYKKVMLASTTERDAAIPDAEVSLFVVVGFTRFSFGRGSLIRISGTWEGAQSAEFHDKWIAHRKGHEPEFLAAPEVSTLNDLAASFQNIEGMKAVPLDKGALLAPIIAAAIRLLPAVTAQIPPKVILKSLTEAMK
jgi:hypothetical protein